MGAALGAAIVIEEFEQVWHKAIGKVGMSW